ncbi:terminase small subunit [Novosphingobium sp. Leaf2]|uniref:terminase small subunit n=1 Tax=Novosphingobium sp. Leaf2 TaxID=1735670 RepID=UPI0006FFF44B|nr:terminase small subunit [Novosphingobium sp. Leaf2]KQM18391.1 terminase [Novosphingobium sp. Leaf2]
MSLTPKQQTFVDEYLIDLNGTQAAIRAGYSAKTATSQAERLLRNVDVQSAVCAQKAARSEKTGIDAAWVLARLAMEAQADLADLYEEGGSLKPVKEWPLIWRQGLIQGVETVREGSADDISIVDKIKISDRIKRIELIGKHVGVQAFKDRLEVDVTKDLAALLGKARERAIGNSG